MDDKTLNLAIDSITNTFKFHGVTIDKMDIDNREGIPTFSVSVSKAKSKKSLNDTLNLVYWTLCTLVYGKNRKDSDIIKLNYTEVE